MNKQLKIKRLPDRQQMFQQIEKGINCLLSSCAKLMTRAGTETPEEAAQEPRLRVLERIRKVLDVINRLHPILVQKVDEQVALLKRKLTTNGAQLSEQEACKVQAVERKSAYMKRKVAVYRQIILSKLHTYRVKRVELVVKTRI